MFCLMAYFVESGKIIIYFLILLVIYLGDNSRSHFVMRVLLHGEKPNACFASWHIFVRFGGK